MRSLAPIIRRSLPPTQRSSLAPIIRRSLAPRDTHWLAPRNERSLAPARSTSLAPSLNRSEAPPRRASLPTRPHRSLAPSRSSDPLPGTSSRVPSVNLWMPLVTSRQAAVVQLRYTSQREITWCSAWAPRPRITTCQGPHSIWVLPPVRTTRVVPVKLSRMVCGSSTG